MVNNNVMTNRDKKAIDQASSLKNYMQIDYVGDIKGTWVIPSTFEYVRKYTDEENKEHHVFVQRKKLLYETLYTWTTKQLKSIEREYQKSALIISDSISDNDKYQAYFSYTKLVDLALNNFDVYNSEKVEKIIQKTWKQFSNESCNYKKINKKISMLVNKLSEMLCEEKTENNINIKH